MKCTLDRKRKNEDCSLPSRVPDFSTQLPGEYYELNIHFGVFVGGQGDFTEIFVGNNDNFRGCMDQVYYNGIDVLARAKVSETLFSTIN